MACLPSCTDADRPPRYAPILAGEHMLAKLERRAAPAYRVSVDYLDRLGAWAAGLTLDALPAAVRERAWLVDGRQPRRDRPRHAGPEMRGLVARLLAENRRAARR